MRTIGIPQGQWICEELEWNGKKYQEGPIKYGEDDNHLEVTQQLCESEPPPSNFREKRLHPTLVTYVITSVVAGIHQVIQHKPKFNRRTSSIPKRRFRFNCINHRLRRDISLIRKPTIAMTNGAAVGSDMDVALHCDIRVGCEATRFVGYHELGQIFGNSIFGTIGRGEGKIRQVVITEPSSTD